MADSAESRAEAMRKSAHEVRQVVDRNVPVLRDLDMGDLADEIERVARDMEALAREHDLGDDQLRDEDAA